MPISLSAAFCGSPGTRTFVAAGRNDAVPRRADRLAVRRRGSGAHSYTVAKTSSGQPLSLTADEGPTTFW